MPSFFVIEGRDQGRRFELHELQMGVGRDASNSVRLHDTEVSRRHAEIRRLENGFEWVDLGSSNGSFINSVRVDRQLLRSGDRVQVGRTLMIYTETPDPELKPFHGKVDIVGSQEDALDSQIVRAARPDESPLLVGGIDANPESWLARARGNLQVMYHTALAVSHTLDIDQLLERIMELIFEWVEADRGCIMLLDRDSDQWVPKVRRDRHQRHAEQRMTISRTILDYVRAHQEGVLTSDARDDGRWDPAASIVTLGVREAICVPMQGRYGIVGVIYIDTFTPPVQRLQMPEGVNRFSDEHLKLMVAIGHQAALAVEDTSYYSAMVQAERLAVMGQTIAGLSHHVKNILQGMRGGGFLIQEGLKTQDLEVARKGWEIVDKNQERISTLVMDMLTFSKEREPEVIPSDLNEVVGDVLELMQGRASEEGVQLVDRRDLKIPRMQFDPEGLHRAVLNVVTNAIDACVEAGSPDDRWEEGEAGNPIASEASGEGPPAVLSSTGLPGTPVPESSRSEPVLPSVEIQTQWDRDAEKLVVSIRDNGPGIRPDQLKRIFSMFVSSKGHRGTGLGLAVSQKILHEHGGQIAAESEPGKGSCFRLEFPAIPADSPPTARWK